MKLINKKLNHPALTLNSSILDGKTVTKKSLEYWQTRKIEWGRRRSIRKDRAEGEGYALEPLLEPNRQRTPLYVGRKGREDTHKTKSIIISISSSALHIGLSRYQTSYQTNCSPWIAVVGMIYYYCTSYLGSLVCVSRGISWGLVAGFFCIATWYQVETPHSSFLFTFFFCMFQLLSLV